MGTWSISPTDGGASIDENGVANIPSNVGGDDFITYEIKYTDDDGCQEKSDSHFHSSFLDGYGNGECRPFS